MVRYNGSFLAEDLASVREDLRGSESSGLREILGGHDRRMDVGTYLDIQKNKEEAKNARLKTRVEGNHTFFDYAARGAVGTGEAIYTVGAVPFKVGGFFLRGGYKVVEGVGKFLVGVIPALAPALVAYINLRAQREAQQRENNEEDTPGDVNPNPPTPEGGAPINPNPNPQRPTGGAPIIYQMPMPQGNQDAGGQNYRPKNTNANTVSPTISPVNTANPTNTYAPVNTNNQTVNVYLGRGKVEVDSDSITPKPKSQNRKSSGKKISAGNGRKKRVVNVIYALVHGGNKTELSAREYGLLDKRLEEIRESSGSSVDDKVK